MIESEATQWSDYLPPQKLSQKRVKHRENEVHEEKSIKFLSYEALPALRTVEMMSISQIDQTPVGVQRKTITEIFKKITAQLGLRNIILMSSKQTLNL